MRIAAQTVVGWLVFLALIKNYSTSNSNPFELTPNRLTAKEGSCAEIKCIVSKAVTVDGAYWFWMKDGKWNDTVKDFTGTIVYSSNFSRRLVSSDFEGRVKYFGSSSSLLRNQYQPFCSILICDLKKSDSGEFSFRFEGNKKWVTKKNVSLEVQENPCLLTFQKPPAVNESDTITLTCSTLSSCNSKLQIQDLGQSQPLTQSYSVKQHEKSTTVSFTARLQDNGKVFLCQTEGNEDKYSIRNISVTVEYAPKDILAQGPQTVKEGDSVDLRCSANGNPPPNITLRRISTSNPQFLEIPESINDQHHVSTLHHSFNVTSADTGSYSCSAVNSEGSKESKQRKLLVKYIPKDVTVKPLSGLVVNENAPLTLSCDAQSYPSVTSFTWMKMTDGKHEPHKTTQTLTIKSASPSDSGWYSCEATNEIGTGKSQPVEVKVKYGPKHTTITITATKQERDGKSSMTLTCSSHGYPPLKFSWRKKGEKTDKNVAYRQNYTVYSDNPGVYYCIAENEMNRKSSDPVHVFDRDLKKILMVLFISFFILLICFSILFFYRHRRRKSIQQGTTNTQPLSGFLGWWNSSRRGNLTNETVLTEPSRSRDDLLPDQPFRPRAQQRQPRPDSTPASNINSVYSTVNLPHGKPAPAAQKATGQQGGHTQDDSLNYASLHFWNKNQQGEAEEDVYTKVSKPKPLQKNEQGRTDDYENFTVAHAPKSPNPLTNDSETSDDEVDVNYSQVSFKPKPGHQRVDTDSSTSDEDEIQYSDVKV